MLRFMSKIRGKRIRNMASNLDANPKVGLIVRIFACTGPSPKSSLHIFISLVIKKKIYGAKS